MSIVPTVSDLIAINVDGIIVKSGISDEPHPLFPAHGYVVSMVFVQVFAKVT